MMQDIRARLATLYLDIAERLPHTERGTLGVLQRLREYQRDQAAKGKQRYELPEEFEYKIVSIRLFDLYSLDSIDRLTTSLVDLLPGLEQGAGDRSFVRDIEFQSRNIGGTAWWNLGYLYNSAGGRFFGPNSSKLNHLPTEIDYLSLELRKILPSLFVLTLDVYLTSQVDSQIKAFLKGDILPEVRFKQLIPHGRHAFSHSSSMYEAAVAARIRSYLSDIERKLVAALPKAATSGALLHSGGRMPHINVFEFEGFPAEPAAISQWTGSNHSWWTTLGFNFLGHDLFTNGKILLSMCEYRKGTLEIPYSLALFREALLADGGPDMYGSEDNRLRHQAKDFLDGLMSSFPVLEFLRKAEGHVGALGRELTDRFGYSPLSLRRLLKTNHDALRFSTQLSRLSLEFEHNKQFVEHDLRDAEDYSPIGAYPGSESSKFAGLLLEGIDFRMSRVLSYLDFTEASFSRYVNLLNTASIYWLTLIVSVVTILGVVGIGQFQAVAGRIVEWALRLLPLIHLP